MAEFYKLQEFQHVKHISRFSLCVWDASLHLKVNIQLLIVNSTSVDCLFNCHYTD